MYYKFMKKKTQLGKERQRKKIISVRLGDSDLKELKKLAKLNKEPVSKTIRKAIKSYIEWL